MLLIPIAQEQNTVRRTPWVSFVLIALCVLTFLAIEAGGSGEREFDGRLSTFLSYLADHPYLAPAPEIASLMAEGFTESLEGLRDEWEEGGGTVDPATRESQQAELDEMAREALEALHATPSFRYGFVPSAPRVSTAFTSMFMHSGWSHLLGNMLFLFLTAPFIEDRYGRPLFAAFYVLCGLAALAAHVSHQPESPVPMVGASGAIAGVMGAFLVRLGAARIRFLFLPIPLLWMWRYQVVLPAFLVLPLWLLEQLWYASSAPEAGVAWWAHIGGFTFGLLFALALKGARVEEKWIHPAIEKEVGIDQNPALERAMDARLGGDLPDARRELRGLLQAEPENVDAWRESYETALLEGDPTELARAGERILSLAQRMGQGDLAAEVAQDQRWRDIEPLATRFHVALGSYLEKAGDGRGALEQYEIVVARSPTDPAALRALMRRADILKRGGDRKGAREALLRAQAHAACSDSWPALIEKGLRELSGPP